MLIELVLNDGVVIVANFYGGNYNLKIVLYGGSRYVRHVVSIP